MNNHGSDSNFSQASVGRKQLIITAQLYRAATTMRHIDELFLWIVRVIMQAFDIQVTQLWAQQAQTTGQYILQLRAMARQDNTLPSTVVANQQVGATIEYVFNEQHPQLFQRVDYLFSTHQGTLLMRYGLNYCSGYFLRNPARLPPAQQSSTAQEIPTPLTIIVLLLTRQPLSADVLAAINLILEQAIPIAGKHGLLLPASNSVDGSSYTQAQAVQQAAQQAGQFNFSELIPYPLEDAALMKSNNPFAGSVAIPDKQARRLYATIDGHKNLAEICRDLNTSLKDVYPALQYLLTQQRIQLATRNGQIINNAQLPGKL
ncbi:MAG TPA: hypothetical protein VFB12_13575 [Ktedonobacteraceae bacterium]|nr:hypothetical protein [Ktedonobacteraceae bacterium]